MKIKQNKIPINFKKVSLKRLDDGLVKTSTDLKFMEWDKNKKAKELQDDIKVGRSAILAPFNSFFTWMTSEITEVISDTEFKTKNSHYKIEYEY